MNSKPAALLNSNNKRANVLLRHLRPTTATPSASSSSSSLPHNGGELEFDDVCGIIAYVGKPGDNAPPYLIEGLEILQNRGYDSAGICTIQQHPTNADDNSTSDLSSSLPPPTLVITKYASAGSTSDAIDRLKKTLSVHQGHHVGIAHTRWATHGGKTDTNAHPHTDYKKRVALVHNGVIENSTELKKMLLEKNPAIKFTTETDTEVIAQLIGHFLDQGLTILNSLQEAIKIMEGTWGLVVVSTCNPEEIIAARNGSPLLIGLSQGRTFVASEASVFSRYTRDFVSLDNGEVAVVKANSSRDAFDIKRIQVAEKEEIKLSPDPYPHWTIKEIDEQPAALSRALNYGGRFDSDSTVKLGGLEQNKDRLVRINRLVIAACGTSFHAGQYGAKLMRQLRAFESVSVVDAAELSAEDFPFSDGTGLLVISQSGETRDVVRSINVAEELDIPTFSVVNAVGSEIARLTKCGVYTNSGREHAVASTKAFTAQVVVLALIAIWFTQNRGYEIKKRQDMIDGLHKVSTCAGRVLSLRPRCHDLAVMMLKCQTCFILGRGLGEPIAREAALKIKEISYVHAEGYPLGSLKHGPFALIDKDTPIFIIMLNDAHASAARTTAEQVRGRGALVIGITDNPQWAKEVCHFVFEVPSCGHFTPLLSILPFQMVAYELSVLRGINPDKPRNLAKAVTVI